MIPTLYIIMRSDLQDCNPGKGMSQAAHAQAEFDDYIGEVLDAQEGTIPLLVDYAEWTDSRSFGRTIVLSAPLVTLEIIADLGTVAGLTVDPTYPWKNYYGELQVTKETTCAWLFLSDENEREASLVSELSLHR